MAYVNKFGEIKSNKINFTSIDGPTERVMNENREIWETFKVPQWVANRAAKLIEEDARETFILEADEEKSTVTFCYAQYWIEEDDWFTEQGWEGSLDGAFADMFLGSVTNWQADRVNCQ